MLLLQQRFDRYGECGRVESTNGGGWSYRRGQTVGARNDDMGHDQTTSIAEMMRKLLWLDATDGSGEDPLGVSVPEPVWSHVELRVKRAFAFGGQVKLWEGVVGPDDKTQLGTHLGMEARSGACRLIYSPQKISGERSKSREWWEPGDAPFRGTTNFNDHEWDDRTVCRDVSVALQMFRDFFDNGDLTDSSLKQTRSVWDRKPR